MRIKKKKKKIRKKRKKENQKSQIRFDGFSAEPVILFSFPVLFLWPQPQNVKLLFVHLDL